MTWSRSTKLLLLAGCLAAVLSVSGVMTGFSEGVIRSMITDFYPGPCTGVAPSNITITYEGSRSGCTPTNGIQCQAGEEIRFEGSSSSYNFQICDRFFWTVGDRQVETVTPDLPERFALPGARTVKLTVINPTGQTDSNTLTLGTPAPVSCGAGNDRLCLRNGRFRVTLIAEDPRTGNLGIGLAVPENDQAGYFAVPALTLNPNNYEVFVKVLGPVPPPFGQDNFWVFFGGLTDMTYTLTVFDTVTGLTETYVKQTGENQSGLDTSSFVSGPFGAIPGTCPEAVVPRTEPNQTPGACTTAAGNLCLLDGRFRITLAARNLDASGNPIGSGPGVAFRENKEFGYFALPALTGDPNNPEVFVKLLDARAIGFGFFLFFQGLTHFEYTLTVTDMQTGRTRSYLKPFNSRCGGTDVTWPAN